MKEAQQILSEFVAVVKKHDKGIYQAPAAPRSYVELEKQADVMDFHEVHAELKKLAAIGNVDEIRNRFKLLMTDRFAKFEGTSLGFFANSKRECLQLLWASAAILFEPASLFDMMKILFPTVTNALVVDVRPFVLEGRLTRDKIKYRIAKTALADHLLGMPADIQQLRYFVLSGDGVFDVRQMQLKDFRDQKALFLADNFPLDLKNKIFRFNDSLAELGRDLTTLVAQGKSIFDMITDLEYILSLENEKYKSASLTSFAISTMIKEFHDYIESLPSPYKAAVLQMKTSRGETLNQVFYEQISLGTCSLKAVDDLRSLKNNPVNSGIVHAKPKLPIGLLPTLVRKYKQVTLSLQGEDNTKKIPSHLSKKLLKNYVINDAEDYLELLLKVPVEEMELFLTSCTLRSSPRLPVRLAEILSTAIFTPEQVAAFFACIWKHRDRFDGEFGVLMFAAACRGKYFIEFFAQLDEKKRLEYAVQRSVSESGRVEGYLLEQAITHNNRDAIATIIANIPEKNRLPFLIDPNLIKLHKSTTSFFFLSFISNRANKQIFMQLMGLLPITDRINVVTKLLAALTVGDALISVIELNPTLIEDLVEMLPKEARSSVVSIHSGLIITLRSTLEFGEFDKFTTIFFSIPPLMRLEAIYSLAKLLGGLKQILSIELLDLLFVAVPEDQLKGVIPVNATFTSAMIATALRALNLTALQHIISFTKPEIIATLLTDKVSGGHALLHDALSIKNGAMGKLQVILAGMTPQQLKRVLMVTNNSGENVLLAALRMKEPDIALYWFSHLAPADHLSVLDSKILSTLYIEFHSHLIRVLNNLSPENIKSLFGNGGYFNELLYRSFHSQSVDAELSKLLSIIPDRYVYFAMTASDASKYTLLQELMNKSLFSVIGSIFKKMTKDEVALALKVENASGITLMDLLLTYQPSIARAYMPPIAPVQWNAIIADASKKLFPSFIKNFNNDGVRRFFTYCTDKEVRFAVLSKVFDDGNTPLHKLMGGVSPDIKIALLIAESLSSAERVRLMHIHNAEGLTPLDLAVTQGYVGVAQEMLRTIPADSRESLLKSAMPIAVKAKNLAMVQGLFGCLDGDQYRSFVESFVVAKESLLQMAVNEKSIELLLFLLGVYPESDIDAVINRQSSSNHSLVSVFQDIMRIDDDRLKQFMKRASAVAVIQNETAVLEKHLKRLPASGINDAKIVTLEELKSSLNNPNSSSQEKLANFSCILQKNANVLMRHSDSKTVRILKNIGHILASILTLGAYAAISAAHSYKVRGSAHFWKSHEEIFIKRSHARITKSDDNDETIARLTRMAMSAA